MLTMLPALEAHDSLCRSCANQKHMQCSGVRQMFIDGAMANAACPKYDVQAQQTKRSMRDRGFSEDDITLAFNHAVGTARPLDSFTVDPVIILPEDRGRLLGMVCAWMAKGQRPVMVSIDALALLDAGDEISQICEAVMVDAAAVLVDMTPSALAAILRMQADDPHTQAFQSIIRKAPETSTLFLLQPPGTPNKINAPCIWCTDTKYTGRVFPETVRL